MVTRCELRRLRARRRAPRRPRRTRSARGTRTRPAWNGPGALEPGPVVPDHRRGDDVVVGEQVARCPRWSSPLGTSSSTPSPAWPGGSIWCWTQSAGPEHGDDQHEADAPRAPAETPLGRARRRPGVDPVLALGAPPSDGSSASSESSGASPSRPVRRSSRRRPVVVGPAVAGPARRRLRRRRSRASPSCAHRARTAG